MQNWDAIQPAANYEQHNNWYNTMFAANIKQEPGTTSPTPTHTTTTTQLEQFLKQQQQQQQHQPMDTMPLAMTPSPSNNDNSMQHFFDNAAGSNPANATNANTATVMQQQFLQQQQHYQQHFQQAQQAAAQNHHQLNAAATHLTLGFNPLTPPGLPNAILPQAMSQFYANMQQQHSGGNGPSGPQHKHTTPSPQPIHHTPNTDGCAEQLKAALTPRNTPPMDVTPPKSPLVAKAELAEKDHDQMSNSSEDMKYMVHGGGGNGGAESDDDETIRMPIYNSHGKMKNYKCKTCGLVAITKVAFWEHTRTHMKPDKILQCPKCPFVTEFKHHLEYHIRKHKNQKPFQCDKCSYTCVNKSMLNSHRKSHSSVYQYRCADCDYATKYCHSFKLHLRKYDHKPGMVLDEDGTPNPALVIDVYGTRRGPKNKSGGSVGGASNGSGSSSRRSTTNAASHTSQLSAALQGYNMQQQQQQQNMPQQPPASPAKSTASSCASDLPSVTHMSLQQHQQQQQAQQQQQPPQQLSNTANAANLLPPLASILQQNHNMAFFPYWNLNLQMLAAQQQAAVLAQMSPRMRETALQQIQQQQQQRTESEHAAENDCLDDDDVDGDDGDDDDDDDDDAFERKSVDSAMDLSQGTPTKEEQYTPNALAATHNAASAHGVAMNLKLTTEQEDTPLFSTSSAARRKGRVLKLDTLLQLKTANGNKTGTLSPEPACEMPIASSPNATNHSKHDDAGQSSADECMEPHINGNGNAANSANTSTSSTASSSGNSSNASSASSTSSAASTSASSTSTSSASSAAATSSSSTSSSSTSSVSTTNVVANAPAAKKNSTSPVTSGGGAIYECKYCDIYFKDAVLYTIHMGYHSCDDVFKCNMCGEKCDGPVGLFVHMARNAHS